MKTLKQRRKRQGGFVLLVVLALLVLLTIVASLAYTRASEQVVMSGALMRQSIAQDRAVMGMRRAVSDVQQTPRPPSLAGLALPPCTLTNAMACPVVATMPPVDNGTTLGLEQGGGLQYEVEYRRWLPAGATGALIIVRAFGYHGYDSMARPGSTRMTSEVIVEVSEGEPNTGGCVGYCGAGL